jgi:hypothetical protein
VVPAKLRIFSVPAVGIVMQKSRSTLWRAARKENLLKPRDGGIRGVDVVAAMQKDRLDENLPLLDESAILDALVAAEAALLASGAEDVIKQDAA